MRADDGSRGLSNNAKQILLKQAADAEEKIKGFVSTTEFITSSREALNALRLASRPLLDKQMKLEPDASLETLLALLNELEHKNICAQARERLSAQNTPSQNPTDCYRPFDVFYSRQLFALIEPAMWLQSQWVHAAATRLTDEYIDALKADPARVRNPNRLARDRCIALAAASRPMLREADRQRRRTSKAQGRLTSPY
ncbi:MAG: hypothetical protein ACTHKH_01380 [Trinickia sp.]